MGQFIVKTARDVDLYLVWSTVVDSAIWVGNRQETLAHEWQEYWRDHPDCTPRAGKGPDARIARADRLGTSAVEAESWYGWDDDAFQVGEAAPHDDRWWELPRTNLVAYAQALLADDEAACHALLRPIVIVEEADTDG